MSNKNYEPLSFLASEVMYNYQKEVFSIVNQFLWDDVNLVFDKKGRGVGRTTIAVTIYWLLKEKGRKVLFASRYPIGDKVSPSDVIFPASNLDKHRGKRADVIIFDECDTEDVDTALSTLNAKGIIFNSDDSLNIDKETLNFMGLLDEISESVDDIIKNNEAALPEYMVDIARQWAKLTKSRKLDVATTFAKHTQPDFISKDSIYIDFNNKQNRCDM